MKLKNTILLLLLFSSITIIIGCSKTVAKTPLEFQKELLAGTGKFQNTKHIWQLDSTYVNGVIVPLPFSGKNFKKTFNYDGGYSDTDNNNGVWEINTINKLKQTLFSSASLIQDSLTYDIVYINSVQLKLSKKVSNGQIAIYTFKIVN